MWHDAIVGSHDEQREVDAAGTRQHGVYQALVAGYVDESEHLAVGEWRVGVTELDRDTPQLLFAQPVGVDARERAHQRRLAMVDVSCRADEHGRGAASEMQRIKRCKKLGFVAGLEAAQVEPQGALRDAANDGARQYAQRLLETREARAFSFHGADREPVAR